MLMKVVRVAAGAFALVIAGSAPALDPARQRPVSPPQSPDLFGIPSSGSGDALGPLLTMDLLNPYVGEAMKPIDPESKSPKASRHVNRPAGFDSFDRLTPLDPSAREDPTPITEFLTGKRWQPEGDDENALTLLLGDGETTGSLALEIDGAGSVTRPETAELTRAGSDRVGAGDDDPGHLKFVGYSALNAEFMLQEVSNREMFAIFGLLGPGFLVASGCDHSPCAREEFNPTAFGWTMFGQIKS